MSEEKKLDVNKEVGADISAGKGGEKPKTETGEADKKGRNPNMLDNGQLFR